MPSNYCCVEGDEIYIHILQTDICFAPQGRIINWEGNSVSLNVS